MILTGIVSEQRQGCGARSWHWPAEELTKVRRDAMRFDPIYLVLRSGSSRKPQLLLIGDSPEFEKGLRTYYIESDYMPLGLLAWEEDDGVYQARKKPFPWVAKDADLISALTVAATWHGIS